ncbi:DUF2155 domain-containing protein [Novosphingobium flavum]|uniref:DUF2155 domain-containing protein n=1 Tax=Novosphingobium flavum TaxID=1778672 RepID=A0A7X1FTX2_9SPHN|nr:DUF2155 domain-containing protein [Novosphingobium flavum]MBC2666893.1 DUF2155 domain-containing protein [Novosphingobium flavum]
MKRALSLLGYSIVGLTSVALGGCGQSGDAAPEATEVPKDFASSGPSAKAVESQFGTPVKDRVATIGLLNKRNNLTQDLVMKTGESRRVGNVIIKLANCERTLPWENPPEVGAFVQVFVEERASVQEKLAWHKVFSGWLFKDSPSLNTVEHPVYDVWVKDCAMKFPGEEEDPAAYASSSSAAKASGKASTAPAVAPAPSASPSAAPSPAPAAVPAE